MKNKASKMTTWLHEQRLDAVHRVVMQSGASTILDLGCGDGDLLVRLAVEPHIKAIAGIDLSKEALQRLRNRLNMLGPAVKAQVDLKCRSMMDDHSPANNYDCVMLVESIEHINPEHLSVLEKSLFATLQPKMAVITTPNADFNPLLGVPSHRFRHPEHYFEWGRERFKRWVQGVADRNRYGVTFADIAGCHPIYGGASQMATFEKRSGYC